MIVSEIHMNWQIRIISYLRLTGLYVNTDSKEDIVTLDEIRQRYVDINGTDEGFDNYVADGFYDGNVKEYRPV